MNLSSALYMVDFVTHLNNIMNIIAVLGSIALFIISVFYLITLDDDDIPTEKIRTEFRKILCKWWIPGLACSIVLFIPNKSTMYMMLGASYLQESNLPTKVSKALELKLDDYIKQLTEEKEHKF